MAGVDKKREEAIKLDDAAREEIRALLEANRQLSASENNYQIVSLSLKNPQDRNRVEYAEFVLGIAASTPNYLKIWDKIDTQYKKFKSIPENKYTPFSAPLDGISVTEKKYENGKNDLFIDGTDIETEKAFRNALHKARIEEEYANLDAYAIGVHKVFLTDPAFLAIKKAINETPATTDNNGMKKVTVTELMHTKMYLHTKLTVKKDWIHQLLE